MPIQSKSKMLIAAVALAVSGAAYAEDKPQAFRASFLPEVSQKYLNSLNLTDVPLLEGMKELERHAPFLGEGSLDFNKPFGLMGYVVQPVPNDRWIDRTLMENGAIILPVNKNFATIDVLTKSLNDRNANPVVDGNVVSSERQGNFKRTDNYLVFSFGKAFAEIGDNAFAADYKPGVLASASLDLAAVRKAGPKIYDTALTQLAREIFRSSNNFENAVHEALVKFVRGKLDAIDTANLVISGDDKGLHATSVVAPMNIKPTLAAFPRPTFPTTPAVELHVAYPDAKSATWLADIISGIDFASLTRPDREGPDSKQMDRIKENIVRGAKLFSAADAVSLGVTVDGRNPILLAVNQYAKEIDVAKELTEIAGSANAIAKELKMTKIMEVAPQEASNIKLTRVLFLDNEKPFAYLDVAQAGKTVAIVFAEGKQDGLAAKLLAAPAKGKLDSLITLTFNLKPLVELGLATRSIPRRDGEALRDAVGDISLTATAKSDDAGKTMIVETNIPTETAKQLGGTLNKLFSRTAVPDRVGVVAPAEGLTLEEAAKRRALMQQREMEARARAAEEASKAAAEKAAEEARAAKEKNK